MIDNFDKAYGFLSNFSESPFVFMNETWPTVEHAFQAYKSREKPIRDHIRGLKESRDAKRAGKAVVYRNDWHDIREPLMEMLVGAKFIQNEELASRLVKTSDQSLIEGNFWHDNDWGDCRCDNCHDKPGKNMLGKILMKVRQSLIDTRVICQ